MLFVGLTLKSLLHLQEKVWRWAGRLLEVKAKWSLAVICFQWKPAARQQTNCGEANGVCSSCSESFIWSKQTSQQRSHRLILVSNVGLALICINTIIKNNKMSVCLKNLEILKSINDLSCFFLNNIAVDVPFFLFLYVKNYKNNRPIYSINVFSINIMYTIYIDIYIHTHTYTVYAYIYICKYAHISIYVYTCMHTYMCFTYCKWDYIHWKLFIKLKETLWQCDLNNNRPLGVNALSSYSWKAHRGSDILPPLPLFILIVIDRSYCSPRRDWNSWKRFMGNKRPPRGRTNCFMWLMLTPSPGSHRKVTLPQALKQLCLGFCFFLLLFYCTVGSSLAGFNLLDQISRVRKENRTCKTFIMTRIYISKAKTSVSVWLYYDAIVMHY